MSHLTKEIFIPQVLQFIYWLNAFEKRNLLMGSACIECPSEKIKTDVEFKFNSGENYIKINGLKHHIKCKTLEMKYEFSRKVLEKYFYVEEEIRK